MKNKKNIKKQSTFDSQSPLNNSAEIESKDIFSKIGFNKFILGISFVATYLLFPSFFNNNLANDLKYELDLSWNVALNYINRTDLIYGKDIFYTFGPLGYLYTRFIFGLSKWPLLLFDLFIAGNFIYIFYNVLNTSKLKYFLAIFLFLIIFCYPETPAQISLVLLVLLVYFINKNLESFSLYNVINQLVIVLLMFLIKFNTAFVGLFLYLVSIVYLIIFKKELRIQNIIVLGVTFLLILLLPFMFNLDLKGYIIGGYEEIKGYSESMYLWDVEENYTGVLKGAQLWMLLIVSILSYNIYKERSLKSIILLGNFFTIIFILFKESFVRADGHVFEFLSFIYLILFIIPFDQISINKNFKIGFIIISVLIGFKVMKESKDVAFKENFKSKFSKGEYISQFFKYDKQNSHLNMNYDLKLNMPDSVKSKIGKKTIDSYPYDLLSTMDSNFNFEYRPCLQSYNAFTEFLENQNFNKFNNGKAPQYILFNYKSIDKRYFMFDEPKVLLSILENYKVDNILFEGSRLLLTKVNNKKVNLVFNKSYTINIRDSFVPQKDKYYTIELHRTISSKINSLLYKPKYLYLEFKTGLYNEPATFRTSVSLLKSGLWGNKLISNLGDFYNLLGGNTNELKNINSIKLIPEEIEEFEHQLTISEYDIQIK